MVARAIIQTIGSTVHWRYFFRRLYVIQITSRYYFHFGYCWLAVFRFFYTNAQAQATIDKTNSEVNAPAIQTGSIYSQPVDPNGKLLLTHQQLRQLLPLCQPLHLRPQHLHRCRRRLLVSFQASESLKRFFLISNAGIYLKNRKRQRFTSGAFDFIELGEQFLLFSLFHHYCGFS